MNDSGEDQIIRSMEAERWWEASKQCKKCLEQYGHSAIQASILLNGGAIIATLMLLGMALVSDRTMAVEYASAIPTIILWYIFGLVASVASHGTVYIHYRLIYNLMPSIPALTNYELQGNLDAWKIKNSAYYIAYGTFCLAISFIMVGLGFFITGSWYASSLLEAMLTSGS